MTNVSWLELITEEMEKLGDTMRLVEYSCPRLDSEGMTRKFDSSYGSSEGCAFAVWTAARIYFPVVYDGAEWVGSVPRYPQDEVTKHMGSE